VAALGTTLRFDLLPSTQDEAIRRVREGASPGLCIVALRQHRGRGRLDHRWDSPEGGLYLSLALPEPKFEPGLVPIGVGAVLAASLSERYGFAAVLKWPNDVLVPSAGRPAPKLAGVLVDRVLSPAFGTAVVVGVGINAASVRSAFPPDLAPRVAILSELAGRTVPPEEVEPVARAAIEGTVERLASATGRTALWQQCRGVLYGVGRPVRVDGHRAGILRDLAEDGALLVEGPQGRTEIRAGDVEVEEVGGTGRSDGVGRS